MTDLLAVLTKAYDTKVVDTVKDPSRFGLDQPAAVFMVKAKSGKSQTMTLGGTAPASGKRYLLVGKTGPVVMIPEDKISGLLQHHADFRDKNLFSQSQSVQVTSVAITRGGEKLALLQEKEGIWKLVQPLQDQAAPGPVRAWISALRTASGDNFEKNSPEKNPDWTLRLEFGTKGNQETVRIWRQPSKLLALRTGEPDALTLPSYLAETLDKPHLELVGLRPLFLADGPETLTVLQGEKKKTAQKKKGNWPAPVWDGIEETLTRNAWHGIKPVQRGAPWLTLIAGQGEKAVRFPFWKSENKVFLAPPGRPVELELTQLQGDALAQSVKALFTQEQESPVTPPAEKAQPKGDAKDEANKQ